MFELSPFILFTLVVSNLSIVRSMPSPSQSPILNISPNLGHETSGNPSQDPLIPKMPLRILPLGNSITWGYGSTSGNGYRESLLSLLPNPVTYIGSEHSGNMSNNENEGHPGAIIFQIALFADLSLVLRPNVILLMAGTNDMIGNFGVEEAPGRLGVLIDRCVDACPDAVVLVAHLTPCLDIESQIRSHRFNAEIPGLVSERVRRGKKVLAVDMETYVELGWLMDGLHPSDKGYDGMAKAWYDGLQKAAGKGWIEKPMKVKKEEAEEEEVEEL